MVTIFVCVAALKSHHVSGRQRTTFAQRRAYLEDAVQKKEKGNYLAHSENGLYSFLMR